MTKNEELQTKEYTFYCSQKPTTSKSSCLFVRKQYIQQ